MAKPKSSLSVDARGLLCPYPVKKAEEAIQNIRPGEVLEVVATDPDSKIDIPSWAAKNGYELLAVEDEWLVIRFYVKK